MFSICDYQCRCLHDAVFAYHIRMRIRINHLYLLSLQHRLCNFTVRASARRKQEFASLHRFCFDLIQCNRPLTDRMFIFQLRIGNVIQCTIFVFLCLSVIPVLYGTIVAGNTTVYFRRLATDRTVKMLAGNITVVCAYRISRRNCIIGKLIILCNFSYQRSSSLPVGKLFTNKRMKYGSGCIQSLQVILNIQCIKNVTCVFNRQMRTVCIVRRISLASCCTDIGPALSVMFCQTIRCGLCRCRLQIVKVAILYLIIRKFLPHMIQYLFGKCLRALISQITAKPARI